MALIVVVIGLDFKISTGSVCLILLFLTAWLKVLRLAAKNGLEPLALIISGCTY